MIVVRFGKTVSLYGPRNSQLAGHGLVNYLPGGCAVQINLSRQNYVRRCEVRVMIIVYLPTLH